MLEEFIENWFPHGYCLAWDPRLIAAYLIGDSAIFIAYALIPLAIGLAVRDGLTDRLITRGNAWMWSCFIGSCGLSHVTANFEIWFPVYVATAFIKIATGAISLATVYNLAVTLWPERFGRA